MMDEHTSMHSLQMYTAGPAMSFLTSEWLLPQKEHMVRLDVRAMINECWGKGKVALLRKKAPEVEEHPMPYSSLF